MEKKDLVSADFYRLDKETLFKMLETSEIGLTDQEANKRLETYGRNQLTAKSKISALSIFLEQFKNTLTLILIGSAFLILFIYYFGEREQSDLIEAGLILAIILMITILGFLQEYKAEKAIEGLKKLLGFKAKVKRSGMEKEIDVVELVPGDIVILEEGEKIPADIRLLEVFSLSVNEASLTGESTSVSKNVDVILQKKEIADQENMAFSGTAVSSGRGIGVVVRSGDVTEIGKIASMVADSKEEQTPIQKRLDQIGRLIGYAVIGICVIVFIFIVFLSSKFASESLMTRVIHSFIASVALAVAAIPEGLPAVVTISLALGTQRMLKKNALIRKLNSVETLGSVDVICSDKTGTLTKGEMTVREIYFDGRTYMVSGTGYDTNGEILLDNKKDMSESVAFLLRIGNACNNSKLIGEKVMGDPTEGSLLVSAAKAGVKSDFARVHEIPFSSERKIMSVVVKEGDQFAVYCKGAPEKVLALCSRIQKDGGENELTEDLKNGVFDKTHDMSTRALRNLGFAYKRISEQEFNEQKANNSLEQNLVFVGLQGMIDPPRVEVKDLIVACRESGIRTIMITGDHIDTAKAVAAEIGIIGAAKIGEELEDVADADFEKIVDTVSIYARVNPAFKMRIVETLKRQGHIVAMTGDGVNDAPALKRADIGIAMGITGTDVSKEASDMVLMDDHFSTIVAAIEEGRGIFHNIRKFVMYLLTCNIGEVIVVFLAVIIFHDVPLSATMLLWVNVVTDGLPAVALGLDPAERGIMKYKPKFFQSDILTKRNWVEMLLFGALLAIAVLGIYYINLDEGVEEARGAAFCALVFLELIQLYIIRSSYKISFFSNIWLLGAILATVGLQLLIIYNPFFAKLFEVGHIDLFDFLYILIVGMALWIIFSILRNYFDRIFQGKNIEAVPIRIHD